jgi:hypothetical protein
MSHTKFIEERAAGLIPPSTEEFEWFRDEWSSSVIDLAKARRAREQKRILDELRARLPAWWPR